MVVKPPIKMSKVAANKQITHWAGTLMVLRAMPIATATIKAVIVGAMPLKMFFTAGMFP